MDRRRILGNLLRIAVLTAAMVALLIWALGRDGERRPSGPLTGYEWRRRQIGQIPTPVPAATRPRRVSPPTAGPDGARPEEPQCLTIVTEAYERIGVSEYHAAGYLGNGVVVAVIDTQFDGLGEAIAAGELPATVVARRLTADGDLVDDLRTGDGAHGTACAEIIHDLAPAAQLYLLQVDSFLSTAATMFDLLEQVGVRIVSVSVSVLAVGRADGTGVLGNPPTPIYDILREAYEERDMLIAMSAGNYARQHYAGPFRDRDHDDIHEFDRRAGQGPAEFVSVTAEQGQAFTVYLSWDDWGSDAVEPRSVSDYDLYVFDEGGGLAAGSALTQAGRLPPTESVHITPLREQSYAIQIRRKVPVSGSHNLRLWVTGDGLPLSHAQTPEGSLGPPADAGSVVTVGAVSAASGRHLTTSSQGPTSDGRVKPDVTSYAQVSVSSADYGPAGFTGTSAATPHIAGMAALLLERLGTDTPAAGLREALLSFAADRGRPGPDSVWGVGIAALPALGTEVEVIRPESAPELSVPGDGRVALAVAVRRSDGVHLWGLGADAFAVALNDTPGRVIAALDLGTGYLLRVNWADYPAAREGQPITATLAVTAGGAAATAPVVLRPAAENGPPAARLTTVTQSRLFEVGDPVELTAVLEDGKPISRATVIAHITAPVGRQDILVMHDDGQSGDGVAGDGVYGGRFPQTQLPGRYTFNLVAYAEAGRSEPLAIAELAADVAANLRDEDGDGMPGNWEASVGLNSLSDDGFWDPDADGLVNAAEYQAGADPFNWDTDGDGINDFEEVSGYYSTRPYTTDSDGGGRDDPTELAMGTDPLNPDDDAAHPNTILLPLDLRPYIPTPSPAGPR